MTDQPQQPVRMVVFDLGGVVMRICRSWSEGCEAAGLDVRDGVDAAAIHWLAAARQYEIGEMDCNTFFVAVSEAMDGLYSAHEAQLVHDAWLLGEYAGVDAVIAELHAIGITTGVLSNTNHRHWEQMEREHKTPWLCRHVHASHLLGVAKPNEAIFRAFERAVGIASDERDTILFFDDLAHNVEAARNAGWRAERIDHAGDPASQIRAHAAVHGVFR